MTKTAAQGLGRKGEELAQRFLQERGYRILAQNYRCAAGEMDLIAEAGGYVAFVEVRTRRGRAFGTPEESLTPAKKRHLRAVAETYLQETARADCDWRIDLIAVEMDRAGRLRRIELIENAVTD